MGGEGRGKKKKEIPTSFFARKTRSVLHSRCTEKSVDGWMDGREGFPRMREILFVDREKKKNGKWKKGNVSMSTRKMIYRDWNWRGGGEEGKGSSRVHATRRHDLHSSSLIRVLDNRDVTEYYLIESVSHRDRYIWERDELSLPRCVTTPWSFSFLGSNFCSLYFRCKFDVFS